MSVEEEDVLPLARKKATPADWQAVRASMPKGQASPVDGNPGERLQRCSGTLQAKRA